MEMRMSPYFKSSEFWQCFVFLAWSLFELTITCRYVASTSSVGRWLGYLLLVTGAFFLIRAFTAVVRWRLENPDGSKSPVALTFLYSVGTLALALQTVWYVIRIP
jgi:hypothetical protein